jgi:hypothetical protein
LQRLRVEAAAPESTSRAETLGIRTACGNLARRGRVCGMNRESICPKRPVFWTCFWDMSKTWTCLFRNQYGFRYGQNVPGAFEDLRGVS